MKMVFRHLSSLIAPIVMCLALPALIIWLERQSSPRPLVTPSTGLLVLGLVIGILSLFLFVLTVRMFILIGRGTIMPWDPTRKLIVASVYRYVRNPMILSVLMIQVSEALIFASKGIALTAALFFVINTIYFMVSEEPGLEKRFGAEYVEYKQSVPRWVPRLKPWRPA